MGKAYLHFKGKDINMFYFTIINSVKGRKPESFKQHQHPHNLKNHVLYPHMLSTLVEYEKTMDGQKMLSFVNECDYPQSGLCCDKL